jgi:hypothetical protein
VDRGRWIETTIRLPTTTFLLRSLSGLLCAAVVAACSDGTGPRPAPAVTASAVNPSGGPLAGGTAVTVTGTNFPTTVDSVRVGTGRLGSLLRVSATQLTGTTPPSGTVGAADVTVYTTGAGSGACAGCFTYNPPVTASGVSPASGPLAGGTAVTVTGANFPATIDSVRVGTARLGTLVRVSATQLTGLTPPSGTAGAVDVTVYTTSGGSGGCTACFSYNVAIGSTVDGSVAAGDLGRAYTFTATAGSQYVVFLAVLEGELWLHLQDSVRQHTIGSMLAGPSGRPLEETPTLQFTSTVNGTWILAVSGNPAGAAVRFQFLIYRVNNAPESRPAAFAIGDTVSGETIDPVADVDVFTTQARAGQDLVVVAEAPGATGRGALQLTVLDSSGTSTLGSTYFGTGVPAWLTSGRIHAPASGTYQFKFQAPGSGGTPQFHGAYRFWTYAIDPAPEHLGAAAPFDTVIGGERIDRAGDVDEFTFTVAAGAEVNAFFQSAVMSHLEIAPASGPAVATVVAPADTGLFRSGTGRIALAQAGTYVARVKGDGHALADTGAYRLFLYLIDRRPEKVPAAITPGDSIAGEAIDLPGDVDEFTFTAPAGEEFNAFLQAGDGSAATQLQLEAVDADGTVLATVQSSGADSALLGQVSQRFTMRTTGTHRLRVSGAQPGGASTGPYRLFLSRVNRLPESRPDTLVFGDSVMGETMDPPGDVDEYRVHVADSSGANLVIARSGAVSAGNSLLAQVIDSSTGRVVAAASSDGNWAPAQSAAWMVAPGTYVLRVQTTAWDDRPRGRGPYRLWLYRFGLKPEVVRDTIAMGDTIQGEAIDVPGDVDSYHFYGVHGQHVNLMIQGLATGSGGFRATLVGPASTFPLALVSSPASAGALADHQTLRLDLSTTGWYTVLVSGAGSPPALTELGAYRFTVAPEGTAPETASGTLAVGDSVTSEGIDVRGDWDQYLVAATPATELNVLFGTSGPCCRYPSVLVYDPATGDSLAGEVGQNLRLAGPVRVPASGQVAIAVFEYPANGLRQCSDATCSGVYLYTGPYRLQVLALNRAPETAPAEYTVGDTVRTEAIAPAGDIDEFKATATPGATLSPWYRLRANPVPSGTLITLEVIDAATGTVLAGQGVSLYASGAAFVSPGSFVVPASGSLLIRVRGGGSYSDKVGTAPYEFYLR